MNFIPFNKPYVSGNEIDFIHQVINNRKFSGNGAFTGLCQNFFQERYGFRKCLLTTSCTDALEMAAILFNICPGDEVIMPSFTFVSTANAFILRGAKIVFADSSSCNPNIDPVEIEKLVTNKTKAIVVVHYAGFACEMEKIMAIADKHQLYVVEDAAQAIDNEYIGSDGKKRPLGSIAHLSAFSFHDTKNIQCGEGGMLVINREEFVKRAEIIWEKGTNRSAFFRGEIDKYGWVDVGSSFLMSELTAAFLYGQLQHLTDIQNKRKKIWNTYQECLSGLAGNNTFRLPLVPDYSENNSHLFYIICRSLEERNRLIKHLKNAGVQSVFHYISLHTSPFFEKKHDGRILPHADEYSDRLLRLPLFYDLDESQATAISKLISAFYQGNEDN
jgi:dTDP-4-amino-4,6-dideoxygalactose transaminase